MLCIEPFWGSLYKLRGRGATSEPFQHLSLQNETLVELRRIKSNDFLAGIKQISNYIR